MVRFLFGLDLLHLGFFFVAVRSTVIGIKCKDGIVMVGFFAEACSLLMIFLANPVQFVEIDGVG